jgi:hypothetical protein
VRCEDGRTGPNGTLSNKIGGKERRLTMHPGSGSTLVSVPEPEHLQSSSLSQVGYSNKEFPLEEDISCYLGNYRLEGLSKRLKIRELGFINKHEPVTSTQGIDLRFGDLSCYSRMFLYQYHYTKDGIDAPSFLRTAMPRELG